MKKNLFKLPLIGVMLLLSVCRLSAQPVPPAYPTGVLLTNRVAPATPASGKSVIYVDSTTKNLAQKNSDGNVNHGVRTFAASSHFYIVGINADGTLAQAQPVVGDISGIGSMASQNSTGISISGGAIDGVTIGGTSPWAGTFTSLSSSAGFVATGTIALRAVPDTQSYIIQNASGVQRWNMFNSGAESGSNAGSDLKFIPSNDAGTQLGIALTITRATLKSTFYGIENTPIGVDIPGLGAFTALTGSVTSAGGSASRTLANRANDWTNVLDFTGVDPTGATDSSAGLNAAVAACPATRGTLFFPPGRYKWTAAGSFTISGKTNLTILGAGAELYDGNNAGARPFVVIDKTNSYVKMSGLAFNGNAVARVAGAHQLIFNASHSIVSGCTGTNGSQFTFYIGSDNTQLTTDVIFSDCQIYNTWADGFHIFYARDVVLANCSTNITGDDGCGIIADAATYNPSRITLLNFNAVQAGNAAGGGTHGCSIRINEATDVKIIGGSSIQGAEAGIVVDRFGSTTFYNTRISIVGFKSYLDAAYAGGARIGTGIDLRWVNYGELKSCSVDSPTRTNNNAYGFLDCNNLAVTTCTAHNPGVRGFGCDDGTTSNVAATWSNWFISNNTVDGACSNESYYFTPASTKTIAGLTLSANYENVSGTYRSIWTNYLAAGCKVMNNIQLGSRGGVQNGGGGTPPITANNN